MHRSFIIMSSSTILIATGFAMAQDDADLPAVAEATTSKGILPVPDYGGDLEQRPALTLPPDPREIEACFKFEEEELGLPLLLGLLPDRSRRRLLGGLGARGRGDDRRV